VPSAVVVGGGIAGLGAAWRLRQAGWDVEVLEREAVAGGRMRSERHGEFVIDRGAQFVMSGYRNLRRLAESLGLEHRLRPLGRTTEGVLRDGRLHPSSFDSPWELARSSLLSARGKLGLLRLLPALARRRRRLDPRRPERAASLDDEDLASAWRRLVGDEAFEYVLGPAFSATFDAEPEDLSVAFGWLALRFLMEGRRLECFEGGMGTFSSALAASVPLRTGCEVSAVETAPGGARVSYRGADGFPGSVLADAVVMAVPGSLVLPLCPALTPAERAFFEQVDYVSGAIVFLLLDRAPETLPYYGVAFPRPAGIGLYGLAVDHWKEGVAPPGAGLLNTALTEAAAARLAGAPDTELVDFVLGELARTPVGRLAPKEAVVHRWSPMLPRFRTGYLRRLAAFRARAERTPRLVFAGDYLVGPFLEAALTSGLRAADELLASAG
jgi:oxygen-dependent protoporphyrinogen oxidase